MEAKTKAEQQKAEEDQPKKLQENGDDKGVADIEDTIADLSMAKKKMEILDKTRGFVKYDREKRAYKDAKGRSEHWDEIYDFKVFSAYNHYFNKLH